MDINSWGNAQSVSSSELIDSDGHFEHSCIGHVTVGSYNCTEYNTSLLISAYLVQELHDQQHHDDNGIRLSVPECTPELQKPRQTHQIC